MRCDECRGSIDQVPRGFPLAQTRQVWSNAGVVERAPVPSRMDLPIAGCIVDSLYSLVEHSAERWPTVPAIVDDQGVLTFAELAQSVAELRRQLAPHISPGLGVGVMATDSRSFITALFAALGCGAVVMPIAHQLRPSEIDGLLEQASLAVVVDDGCYEVPQFGPRQEIFVPHHRTPFGLRLRGAPYQARPLAPHVPDAACIRFTSGTTGTAKGVIISHRSVLERTAAAQAALRLQPGEAVTWVLPMAYHFVVSIVMYVRYGITVVVAKDILAQNIIDSTNEHRSVLLYATPLHYQMLANDTSGRMMPSLRVAISTSSPISAEVAAAWRQRFNLPVTQVYGMIEVGLPLGNLTDQDSSPNALGYPLPGYEVTILDDNFSELPPGTIGQLAVRGPGMFDAYLNPPTLRSEVLRNGWLLTGDLAERQEDGRILLRGRSKSVINIAGNKVFPEEVEAVLNLHPAVAVSKVSATSHPLTGEVVQAEIVIKPGVQASTDELQRFCYERLSPFKVPKVIHVVPSLAMTATGKVRRAG